MNHTGSFSIIELALHCLCDPHLVVMYYFILLFLIAGSGLLIFSLRFLCLCSWKIITFHLLFLHHVFINSMLYFHQNIYYILCFYFLVRMLNAECCFILTCYLMAAAHSGKIRDEQNSQMRLSSKLSSATN